MRHFKTVYAKHKSKNMEPMDSSMACLNSCLGGKDNCLLEVLPNVFG